MCFRPADVSTGPKECPSCGKIIPVIPGMPFPENCKGCGADLSSINPDKQTNTTAAPAAPGAPKAPGSLK